MCCHTENSLAVLQKQNKTKTTTTKNPHNPFLPLLLCYSSNKSLAYDNYCSSCSWETVKSLLFIYLCSLYHMLFIKKTLLLFGFYHTSEC